MISILCRLIRLRLVCMNGVAAVAGYLLFPAPADPFIIGAIFIAVSFLAAAGSALNQVMEQRSDKVMQRTCRRPIPSGELPPVAAALIGVGCLVAGAQVLATVGGLLPTLVGIGTLAWYLAVYTPLKRRTSLALALGAFCGAAPPVIGWCVAGGLPGDYQVVLLGGVLYLWQVPHFWLLQRRHAGDYRRAGFPLFTPPGGDRRLAPICLLWLAAMVVGALMLPAFGVISVPPVVWVAVLCAPLGVIPFRKREPALFACLNLFPLLITVALIAGKA